MAKIVVYVENSSQLGGANYSLLTLIRHLDPKRYAGYVICPEKGPMPILCRDAGVPSIVIRRSTPSRTWPFPFRREVQEIKFLCANVGASMIHANAIPAYPAAARAAAEIGVPSVMHVRLEPGEEGLRWIFKHVPVPNAVVFSSKFLLSEFGHIFRGFVPPASRLIAMPNPIDLGLCRLHSSVGHRNTNESCSQGKSILLLVANFEPGKGHETAIQAVRILHGRGRRVVLVLAGGPIHGYEDFKKRIMHSSGKEIKQGIVKFLGFRHDIVDLMAAARIGVCSSYREAFGRTCAEFMAAGKPVVATSIGGYLEQVVDGITGLLVPPGNPYYMADAIDRLLLDPELYRRMGPAAYKRALRLYSPERYAASMQDLYDQLIR